MKILVGQYRDTSYSFIPLSKTIIFSGFSEDLRLEQILMITTMSGNILYNPQMSLLGSITDNILTLITDTTSMSIESLQIFIDIEDPNIAINQSNNELLQLTKRIARELEPMMTVDSNNRQLVNIGTASLTIGTMPSTAVTNITGFGASTTVNTAGGNPYVLSSQPTQVVASIIDQRWEMMEFSRIAYAGVRSKLTFS